MAGETTLSGPRRARRGRASAPRTSGSPTRSSPSPRTARSRARRPTSASRRRSPTSRSSTRARRAGSTAEGRATGDGQPIHVGLTAGVAEGELIGHRLTGAKLGFTGEVDGANVTGSLSGDGALDGLVMRLAGDLAVIGDEAQPHRARRRHRAEPPDGRGLADRHRAGRRAPHARRPRHRARSPPSRWWTPRARSRPTSRSAPRTPARASRSPRPRRTSPSPATASAASTPRRPSPTRSACR